MLRTIRAITRRSIALLTFIAVFALSLLAIPSAPVSAQTNPGVDLMLVLDGSGSISSTGFNQARSFARSLITTCTTGSFRAGAIQFSSNSQVVSPLTSNLADVDRALSSMVQIGALTNISSGLTAAFDQFRINGQPGNQQITVLLTDGYDSSNPAATAVPFKNAGGKIFGVAIGLSDLTQITAVASSPASQYVFNVSDFSALPTILANLSLGACGVTPPGAPQVTTPEQVEIYPAKIHIVQQPTPNHSASPGSIVPYNIKLVNLGKGMSNDSTVTLPLNPTTVEVVDATFSDKSAWVTSITTDTLIFKTGPLDSNSGTITGTIRLRLKAEASAGDWLTQRATLRWGDRADGGTTLSNLPIVVVAGTNDHRPTYAMSGNPAEAAAGTIFTFSSGIFAPNEPVGVWYNTPDGSVSAGPTYYAEADGSLTVTYTNGSLAAGSYSMVFYGHWTEFTSVAPFTIK